MFSLLNCIICIICQSVFLTEDIVTQHYLAKHLSDQSVNCIDCLELNEGELSDHIIERHVKRFHPCNFCSRTFSTDTELRIHVNKKHNIQRGGAEAIRLREVEASHGRRVVSFKVDFEADEYTSLLSMFNASRLAIRKAVVEYLRQKKLIRFSLVVHARYIKLDELGNTSDRTILPMTTLSRILMIGETKRISNFLKQMESEIGLRSEDFIDSGSNWILEDIASVGIECGSIKYRGGCCDEMPSKIIKGTVDACLDKSEKCFLYAIAAGKVKDKKLYEDETKLHLFCKAYIDSYIDSSKMKFPMSVHKIKQFELRNKHLFMNINAFCYQGNGQSFPIYKSVRNVKDKRTLTTINVLLVPYSGKNGAIKYHYTYITDLNKLMRNASNGYKAHICNNCTMGYSDENALARHADLCQNNSFQKVVIPKAGTTLSFQNFEKRIKKPIVGYCDFEATLNPFDTTECQLCKKNKKMKICKHKTKLISEHIPCTYSVLFIDSLGKVLFHQTRTAENVIEQFFEMLDTQEKMFIPLLQKYRDSSQMIISAQERINYEKASKCYLCDKEFDYNVHQYIKVPDHCHYTNNYLGPCHSSCNLRRTAQTKIPIYMHNLSSYDIHFITAGLKNSKKRINAIPLNYQRFKTITIGCYTFLDSLQLLSASLDELVSNLTRGGHSFNILDQCKLYSCEMEKKLLLRKGIYPYEWSTNIDRLRNQYTLPEKHSFYSQLKQSNISDADYEHGKLVFDTFKCVNMVDYCELYCLLDTILLAEVVEAFRATILDTIMLDCCQYISLPQLGYDAMLQTLEEPVELCSDPDMVMLFESSIRGGVSYVSQRHAKLTEDEEKKDEMSLDHNLIYLDCNNLYSVAQSMALPVSNYRWVPENEYKHFDWVEMEFEELSEGFIIECDLDYPSELHFKHNDMPMAPENKVICSTDLSPYSRSCLEIFKGKAGLNRYASQKLCSTLENKKNYVLHYKNLALYLRHGLVLAKVRRVVGFKQKKFVKKYIDLMTKKRKEAKTDFQQRTYKLLCNGVFGKFLERNRNHFEVKFASTGKLCEKYMASPCYRGHKIINEKLVCIFLNKKKIRLDKLYSVGFSILELSKFHMYSIYYDHILENLGVDNVKLCLTDTDSVMLDIKNYTRKEIWDRLEHIMDFSNYPKNHLLYSECRKKIPGYMKDETASEVINEMVGLKAKNYIFSIRNDASKLKVVCKGVSHATKRNFTMNLYKSCLENKIQINAKTYGIRAENHVLSTREVNKIGLSSSDDKRYLLSCGIHSYGHGHEEINYDYSQDGVLCSTSYCYICKI